MFAYSNNGLSFRAVGTDYEAQDGEVLFPDQVAPEVLAVAFPGHAAAQSALARAHTNLGIQVQMDTLDGGGQARAVRLALLAILQVGEEQARLQALEDRIAALRAQLVS